MPGDINRLTNLINDFYQNKNKRSQNVKFPIDINVLVSDFLFKLNL